MISRLNLTNWLSSNQHISYRLSLSLTLYSLFSPVSSCGAGGLVLANFENFSSPIFFDVKRSYVSIG